MRGRWPRIVFSQAELAGSLLAFSLLMLLERNGEQVSPLRHVASPLVFHFVIVPVYLVINSRHDQYFYSSYCCTRYSSERKIYEARARTLLLETSLFYLPLFTLFLVRLLHSGMPAWSAMAHGLNIFIGMLQLGLISSFLHQKIRSYMPRLFIYCLLMVDAWIASGAFIIDNSLYYAHLLGFQFLSSHKAAITQLLLMCAALFALGLLGWLFCGRRGEYNLVEE